MTLTMMEPSGSVHWSTILYRVRLRSSVFLHHTDRGGVGQVFLEHEVKGLADTGSFDSFHL